MEIVRKKTNTIHVGNVPIGGDAPISVQSMTNTKTDDPEATLDQIQALTEAGCEIVRVSFPDQRSLDNLARIKSGIKIPLIADIHFKAELAIAAIKEGADAVRINPGNLGGLKKFALVIDAAKEAGISLRIGVNAGSLQPQVAKRFGGATPQALVESAREYIDFCRQRDFANIKLSLKSSDVGTTIAAYRLAAKAFDCPLHLGLTEAGTLLSGAIRSAVSMGILLAEGIGDTLRVSLSADPVEEVRVAFELLKALGIRQRGLTVTACPTCARNEFDVAAVAERVERQFRAEARGLKVAVMGCPVNGPGEAKEADIGLAGSKAGAMIFRHGEVVERVPLQEAEEKLIQQINKMLDEEG